MSLSLQPHHKSLHCLFLQQLRMCHVRLLQLVVLQSQVGADLAPVLTKLGCHMEAKLRLFWKQTCGVNELMDQNNGYMKDMHTLDICNIGMCVRVCVFLCVLLQACLYICMCSYARKRVRHVHDSLQMVCLLLGEELGD